MSPAGTGEAKLAPVKKHFLNAMPWGAAGSSQHGEVWLLQPPGESPGAMRPPRASDQN